MKKILVMELILFISSMGVMAQTADTKTVLAEFTNQYNKHVINPWGQKQEIQNPELSKINFGNQLKSIWTGKQKPDSIIHWDSTESQWIVYWTSLYTYDSNGNNILDIGYSWDISNQRDTLWKEGYSYDANGNNTSHFQYARKDSHHPFIVWRKDEYTYDTHGNVILDSIYGWDEKANQLLMDYKAKYYYNFNGNLDSIIFYDLYQNTSHWVISYKDEYIYDANANITSFINFFAEIVYDWNSISRQWVIFNKDECTYDAQGSITLDSNFYWDTPNNLTLSIGKSEYTYDVDGNKISKISYSWNETTNQWIFGGKDIYYYSGQTPTSIHKIPENQIRVYPNPARDLIIFDLSNVSGLAIVELYDIEGKKILEQKLPQNGQISVGNLSKGLYLYRIKDNGKKYAGKIMVE